MKKYWPNIKDYLLIALASLIQAASLRIFFVPANLASGGVSGISQLVNHFTGWPIGLMVLIGNVPLFLLGWRFLGGRRFALRTAFAIISYSLLTDLLLKIPLFTYYTDILINDLKGDIFLNSLYGAIISGIGYGLVYRARGTSGGSDILARILNKWRGVSMTQSYLIVDTAVILSAGFIFGWKEALYAMITLYVSGLVSETVLEGGGTIRTAMIITNKPDDISARVLEDLERGVTVLEGTGAFSRTSKPVLYCVISRAEVSTLKTIVNEIDPEAFMVIGVAHEALGEGFSPLKGR
ncbi:MAG: YitT family protein [Anaerolineales bacterium]|uniref:YitT family protein n=1 Tax=Candidatus Villigracilis saccharophilus TaxID=3140684 RepID=UPI003136789E|nr:YitT family protein [Anaerolineales bacterium]MBK8419822.1 YitT family protein [Anaerolineales bacterium]